MVLQPPADRIVYALKYDGWEALGRFMGEALARLALPPDVEREATLVVPVATTPARLRQRGYNQAQVIARAYAAITGRRCVAVLERTRGSETQVSLQPADRIANVAGVFRVRADTPTSVDGAHLILVDDVLTTGATVLAAAGALRAAGARAITVLTFARALPGGE
ncbi:MAG: ComF family protein [Gemmatimonadetes bacterium]|nr:ComF family protein [Gemmatimonadota bacterium]